MITVGVDLATEPAKTAMAVVDWWAGGAAIQSLVLDVDDAAITDAALDADKLGLDCPLGWPDDFLRFRRSITPVTWWRRRIWPAGTGGAGWPTASPIGWCENGPG